MAERPKGYGMTAELQEKKAAKRDSALEKQAKEWMQAVAGEPFPSGSYEEALKNGIYLCKVMNKLQPGSVKKINTGSMAFKLMENISNFLDAATAYGVPKADMFQTVDLFEAENIPQVTSAIHALGRQAQKKGHRGPTLGVKPSERKERQFSEDQKTAGQGVIGLQMGSNKGANQAGMTFGNTRHM